MTNNLLATEKSPYLRQHADNPVHWYPWGETAFKRAKSENKPIFLSIGYSTCHWCHVMAHESFEDPDLAEILNKDFISIKVDREERPDIDHIYMNAVMAITGHGGWPLSVFLRPDQKPFYGGTYFPPEPKWGTPAFSEVLRSISSAWNHHQSGINSSAEELTNILNQSSFAVPLVSLPGMDVIDTAVSNFKKQFDSLDGGFGSAPKFPMGHVLSFLLSRHRQDPQAVEMARHTLDVMCKRGIHDQLASGFHRYATDQHWQVPHFEKMLYDQALLVFAYTQCFQVTQNSAFAKTACCIMDYVLTDMRHQEGAFFCAYDADSDGREGAFYVFTDEEIDQNLDGEAAIVFKKYFGITAKGNVEHDPHGEFVKQNILFQALAINPKDEKLIDLAKQRLLTFRSARHELHLDDKILTDWNGLMMASLSFGGAVLREQRFIDAAKKCADFILDNLLKDDQVYHSWHSGTAQIQGLLDDHAFLSLGLTFLYEATFEEKYLQAAIKIADLMIDRFEDKSQGGFFMNDEHQGLMTRPIDIDDGAMPSGNSGAVHALMKLFFITKNSSYEEIAKRSFKRFMSRVSKNPQSYPFFLQAFGMYLDGPLAVCVEGNPNTSQLDAIRKIVYKYLNPNLVFYRDVQPKPFGVQVCRQGVCGLRTDDMNEIQRMLE